MPLQQIPAEWSATLDAVEGGGKLAIYTHRDAVIFDNSVTCVQLGLYDGDTVVAVKRTQRPADEAALAKALREKDTLKALRHDHVVSYFSHAVSKYFIYVALEPFVALPLVAGQQATSLTLKHIVKEKKEARCAVGWRAVAVAAEEMLPPTLPIHLTVALTRPLFVPWRAGLVPRPGRSHRLAAADRGRPGLPPRPGASAP